MSERRDNVFALRGGGPGGRDGDMEARVKRLEEDMKEIKGDLKSLLSLTSKIEGKIDGLPSAYEFGQLKGRVDMLPTWSKLGIMIGVATAVTGVLIRWNEITALFSAH